MNIFSAVCNEQSRAFSSNFLLVANAFIERKGSHSMHTLVYLIFSALLQGLGDDEERQLDKEDAEREREVGLE